jgi:hypothetical protein
VIEVPKDGRCSPGIFLTTTSICHTCVQHIHTETVKPQFIDTPTTPCLLNAHSLPPLFGDLISLVLSDLAFFPSSHIWVTSHQ